MARIPDVTDFGARPVVQARAPRVIDQSGDILAEGIGRAASTVSQIGAQFLQRQDQFATASARSEILQADVAVRKSLENDSDYSTYETRYTDAMQKAREAATAKIRSKTDRALFDEQAKLDIERGSASVREAARTREVDVSRANLDSTLEGNRTSALEARDEPTRTAFIQATQDAIAGAQAKGYLTAQEAVNTRQKWTSAYAESFVSMQPVDEQLKLLAKPSAGTVGSYIDPAKRVDMIDSAQRQRLAEEDHAWALSQRAKAQMHENASKDLDHALAAGQLTPAWIEANRNRLSADDYRYGYKALESDAATSPDLYADLRERASLGQDIRIDARAALTGRRISRGDYDRLVSEVESERPGWYKRGSSFISTASGVSDLNPDPAGAQRKASMLDDWATWANENPKATDAQAQDSYKRIVREYSIVNYNNMALMKRAPRFLVGDRNTPDLDATENATVKAFQSGQIDKAEFDRQAQLLKEWRAAWQPTQTK